MIAAVVIASGYSRRMGRSKLALEIGGTTFLKRAVAAAAGASRIGCCFVVLRPEDVHLVGSHGVHPPPQPSPAPPFSLRERGEGASPSSPQPSPSPPFPLRGRGEGASPIEIIPNERAAEGQSASIRVATERLSVEPSCDAIIFSVVDQPFLTSTVFDLLADAAERTPGQILVSTYGGQRGSPVLFPRRYFPELVRVEGDVGGREVMRRHPEAVREIPMPDPAAGCDVDTWEDYLQARHAFSARDS